MVLHFLHLSHNLSLNFLFSLLVFASETSNSSSRRLTSSVLSVVRLHELLVRLSIDSVYGIVETLTSSVDRVFKIQVLLGNVLTNDRSKVKFN
jgi:hypothetical protein